MSNAKRIQRETYTQIGDYTFVVPGNVNRLHIREGQAFRWRHIAGQNHVMTIERDGELWGWGAGGSGQLGANNVSNQVAPRQGLTTLFTRFKKVACGGNNTLALSEYGQAYAWGFATGDGTTVSKSTPTLVSGLSAYKVVDVFPSSGGGFIKTDDGQVWGIGDNTSGKLGTNSVTHASVPTLITGNLRWKKVVGNPSTGAFSMGYSDNGNLYAWGVNANGQFGNGTVTSTSSPVISITAANSSIRDFAVGSAHTLLVFNQFNQEGYTLYSMGLNANGQLGDNTVIPRSVPTLVQGLPTGKKWKQVAAGAAWSMALTEDGDLYAWGLNSVGQVPATVSLAVSTPVLLNTTANWNVKIREISAGENTGYAVDTTGKLWAWGLGSSGQLGDGNLSSGVIAAPNFNYFSTSGYSPRFPAIVFKDDKVLDVIPGEKLTIKVREYETTITTTRTPTILYCGTDVGAIGLDYWGD